MAACNRSHNKPMLTAQYHSTLHEISMVSGRGGVCLHMAHMVCVVIGSSSADFALMCCA